MKALMFFVRRVLDALPLPAAVLLAALLGASAGFAGGALAEWMFDAPEELSSALAFIGFFTAGMIVLAENE